MERVVEAKNLIKELEFLYDRLMNTAGHVHEQIKEGNDAEKKIQKLTQESGGEISRMSFLVNEKIPITKFKIDSEIEAYFNDEKLKKAHDCYNAEFKKIHDFLVNDLPYQTGNFKKIQEIDGLSFENFEKAEKEFINKLRLAKSIKIKSK